MNGFIPIVSDMGDRADIYSRLFKDRIIFLTGVIDDNIANLICSQLLHLQAEDATKEISLYINSPGGSGTAGLAIYDVMRSVNPPIRTVCIGQACSAASLLMCAGDYRTMLKHSRILIHQPLGQIQGQAQDMQIYVEEIMTVKETFLQLYLKHTKLTRTQIEKFLDRDTILRTKEAIEYGLVDEVIEEKCKLSDKKSQQ